MKSRISNDVVVESQAQGAITLDAARDIWPDLGTINVRYVCAKCGFSSATGIHRCDPEVAPEPSQYFDYPEPPIPEPSPVADLIALLGSEAYAWDCHILPTPTIAQKVAKLLREAAAALEAQRVMNGREREIAYIYRQERDAARDALALAEEALRAADAMRAVRASCVDADQYNEWLDVRIAYDAARAGTKAG